MFQFDLSQDANPPAYRGLATEKKAGGTRRGEGQEGRQACSVQNAEYHRDRYCYQKPQYGGQHRSGRDN